ncbi:MAG: kynureninase [Alphaproteobacteria bacterium]
MTQQNDIINKANDLDKLDNLAQYKELFHIPENVIYLDGNSLGVMPKSAKNRAVHTIDQEWGNGLIKSWNDAGWIDAPTRIGDKLATVLGANKGEIVITDTISINLFKTISYALSLSDNNTILVENYTFPSDIYIANGIASLDKNVSVKTIPQDCSDVKELLTDDIAVAVLSDVNFKTGKLLNIKEITEHAKQKGIFIVWDLAHSAGAVDLNIADSGLEFAVGCTYKYLNGGPGSPAFIFVKKELQGKGTQPISGWFSHNNMFGMTPEYTPATDIKQFQTGTYSAITYNVLEESIDIWQKVNMNDLRKKSLALTDFFLESMDDCIKQNGWKVITPLNHDERGSHISFTTEENGYAIVQALIARGVIGDFRSPNVMRFGFTPLYLSFADVASAVNHFYEVMNNKEYTKPEFNKVNKVT